MLIARQAVPTDPAAPTPRRSRRRKAAIAAGLLLLALAAGAVATQPFLFAPAYRDVVGPPHDTVIRRDRWGVPHILGATAADSAYGIGFAHAEDDFPTLQRIYMAVRGRAGELDGTRGAARDYVRALLGVEERVRARYARDLTAEARSVSEAYAQGLNRYAADHPDEVLARGLFPITGRDIVSAAALGAPFFFGMDHVLAALAADRPPPREGGPLTDRGSNGFAVSPRRTGDGSTLFLANSHVDLEGPGSWWEAHVTTRDGIDFAGALPPGAPLPVSGHNRDLAYMSTLNRPDLIDVYRLTLDASGERYRLDGRWRPLERRRVWLRVRFGPVVVPVPRTVYRSVHGPVIVNKSGAFAIRYAGMGEIRAADQLLRMVRARTLAEWSAAMTMRAIPSFNFVYADRRGHVGLFYNGAFPARRPGFDWRGVLPGDRRAAIPTAIVPWAALPRTVDPASGYVFSANNAPWLSSAPADNPRRASFPAWLGVEDDITNRALRASALLEAAPRIGPAELWWIKNDKALDRRSELGRYVLATLRADVRGDPDLLAAQRLLARWDFTFDGRGPADGFAAEFLRDVNKASYAREPLPRHADALANAVRYLRDRFGRIDPPLAELMALRRGSRAFPATGGPDVLRALVSWGAPGTRPAAVFGDSFIQLVRWDRAGRVAARTVVPYGASARPASPHFADQSPLFAAERLKPAWYYPDELEPNIVERYRPEEAGRRRPAAR